MQTIIRISVPKTLRATRPRSTWPCVKRHALLHTSWALWLFCKTLDKNVSPELSEENVSLDTQTQLWVQFCQLSLQQKVFIIFPSFLLPFYWIIWSAAQWINYTHMVTQYLFPTRSPTGSLKWGADLGYLTLFISPARNHNKNLKWNCPNLSWRFRFQSDVGAIWSFMKGTS